MKILLTGANGYIGKKLLPSLISDGHDVICCVRDHNRLPDAVIYENPRVSVVEYDFLEDSHTDPKIKDIDVAYFLIHSMTDSSKEFMEMEEKAAENFVSVLKNTSVKQIVYLGAIANEEKLSRHLSSRKNVEKILQKGPIPVTSLNAGIIVGCGSASFEIIKSLVERFPIILGPRWLNTPSQPVPLVNVIEYLRGVLLNPKTYNQSFDMAGPRVMSYKEMLQDYAKVRGLRRHICTCRGIPLKVAALFLSWITRSNYSLALSLVQSLKVDIIAGNNQLDEVLGINPLSYKEAIGHCCGF